VRQNREMSMTAGTNVAEISRRNATQMSLKGSSQDIDFSRFCQMMGGWKLNKSGLLIRKFYI
jgi:hypothetical protein